jgi:hypothetical protein
MRHFTLMKLLTVSSFAVSPDKKPMTSSPQQTVPAHQIATTTVVPETAQQAAIDNTDNGRRMALFSVLFTSTSAAFFVPKSVGALDMDAFANSQVCSSLLGS